MSILYKFDNEEEATNYLGIVAEYIDYDLAVVMPIEAVEWIKENLVKSVACFYEKSSGKNYFVLLFQSSEDAVAFKLRFL